MKWKLSLALSILTLFTACDKSKYQTKPQITFKSANTTVLQLNQELVITLQFTDKEGDIGQGKLVYIPTRLNKRALETNITNYDSIINVLPDFPDKNKGDFEVHLFYNNLHKSAIQNDTINFRFVATDRAGNKSDTLTTDKFVIIKS